MIKTKKIDLIYFPYIILNEVKKWSLLNVIIQKDGLKYFSKNYPKLKKSFLLSEVKEVCIVIPKKSFFSRHLRLMPLIQLPQETFTGYFFAQTANGNTVEKSLKIASSCISLRSIKKRCVCIIPIFKRSFSGWKIHF